MFTTAAGKVGSRTPYLKGGPDVDPVLGGVTLTAGERAHLYALGYPPGTKLWRTAVSRMLAS